MLGFDKPILLDTAPQILLIQETSDVIQVILDLYQLLQYLRFSLSACAASLQEKGSDEVVFKAMGRAINKTNDCGVNQGYVSCSESLYIVCEMFVSVLGLG